MSDDGISGWGWKQNALIRVDSKTKTATYTPEYFAVKHYTQYVTPGSEILAFVNNKDEKTPVMIIKNPQGKLSIFAGNFNKEAKEITVKIGAKYLEVNLPGHSLNSFQMN